MIRIFRQYVSTKLVLLIALETMLVMLAFVLGLKFRFWTEPESFQVYTSVPQFGLQLFCVAAVFELSLYLNEFYDHDGLHRRSHQMVRLAQAIGYASLVLGVAYLFLPGLLIGRWVFFISTAILAFFLAMSRALFVRDWHIGTGVNVLILGHGETAVRIFNELEHRTDLNVNLVGFLDDHSLPQTPCNGRVLGPVSGIERVIAERKISKVIVALEDRRGCFPVSQLVKCKLDGVAIEDAHAVMTALTGRVWLRTVRPSWFVFSDGFRRSELTMLMKRTADIVLATTGLVIFTPLMLAVALCIRLDSPGPVLYRQRRVGRNGKKFELLKFRSMRADAEAKGTPQWSTVNDPRVTAMGRIIRSHRLDELPQFLNILRGDMSFAGPRPERPEFVDKLREVIPYYDERHSIRPGLTGWAQVKYRYGATVEDAIRKLEYDLFYLQNMSLIFDLTIVIRTVKTVLFGQMQKAKNVAGSPAQEQAELRSEYAFLVGRAKSAAG